MTIVAAEASVQPGDHLAGCTHEFDVAAQRLDAEPSAVARSELPAVPSPDV
jgi:hypothetical protein